METTILVALGSNRRHGCHGRPDGVIAAAVAEMAKRGLCCIKLSRIHATAPLGPGGRRFANAAALVSSSLSVTAAFAVLKAIEVDFGRRRGKRWGDRVLDLDVLAAGHLVVATESLQIPHPRMAGRRFVLDPLVEIAPDWRHPLLHATVRQLRARAMRPKARIRVARRVGP